ncbi:hypothetical protein CHS0354_039217 [Potamilus streckersoni]|uniref:UBX domain-containing protein n=1 Tax=Potamilus streckersoni TaxID=2493646 RepID=A0AAE0TDG2_9BIVA|nr:hypothetical protein CHS0354_039217 [Potamilus streckersoni]
MATLQVLCPNGHRQNIKITPNTKILQILEEVCQKQGFMPPDDFKLVHGKKDLDTTLSVRYANLPNNAKLELVKSHKIRSESNVLVAVQLESGERLQQEFSPGTTLWEILCHWEQKPDSPYKNKLTSIDSSQNPSIQPVCIYMREEVIGEMALKDTSLRTLGLTGGKTVIRLLHRPVEDAVLAEIIDKIEKERRKKVRLQEIAAKRFQSEEGMPSEKDLQYESSQEPSLEKFAREESEKFPDAAEISTESHVSKHFDPSCEPTKLVPAPGDSKIDKSQDETELMEVDSGLSQGKDEVTKHMDNEYKAEPLPNQSSSGTEDNASNSSERTQMEGEQMASDARVAQRSAAEQLRALNIPGVQVFTPNDFNDLTPQEQEMARRLARSFMPAMGLVMPDDQQNQEQTKHNQQLPFSDFKFPEKTKGMDLYHNELSKVTPEDFKPVERQTVVFSLDENVNRGEMGDEDLPDDFYEVTVEDVKKLMADIERKREAEQNQPLMTKALRQAQLEAKYRKYTKVVIRFQFPNRLVLQGVFKPMETIFALQKFVKDHLEEKSEPFYLYTAPPKNVLNDLSQTLLEAHLVPASVVYFGSQETRENYLSKAILTEVSPRAMADNLMVECLPTGSHGAKDIVRTVGKASTSGSTSAKAHTSTNEDSSTPHRSPSPVASSNAKPGVPKWFKIGNK